MPKFVADQTRQLSVRIDEADKVRLEQIRAKITKASSGIEPAVSDVARLAISHGIKHFCKMHDIPYTEKKDSKA